MHRYVILPETFFTKLKGLQEQQPHTNKKKTNKKKLNASEWNRYMKEKRVAIKKTHEPLKIYFGDESSSEEGTEDKFLVRLADEGDETDYRNILQEFRRNNISYTRKFQLIHNNKLYAKSDIRTLLGHLVKNVKKPINLWTSVYKEILKDVNPHVITNLHRQKELLRGQTAAAVPPVWDPIF